VRLEQKAHQMLRNDRVHRREQTGDLVQETYIRLQGALANRPVATPLEFFHLSATIMGHTLIDLARHHYRKEGSAANQANVPLGGSSSAPGFTPADATNDPAELAAWGEFHQSIQALPEELRATFELLYYHGLTQKDAAHTLGVSVPTVKRRLYKARLTLIEELGDNLPGEW
jgi:RNA polymerase sigma-70 factor (ECF subfamily)